MRDRARDSERQRVREREREILRDQQTKNKHSTLFYDCENIWKE